MKVSELIDFLKKQDQNAMVLLSSDEEGNTYSPLDIEHCGYATGNFDGEKDSPLGIQNSIYSVDEDKLHGDYIILYPL